MGVLRNNRGQTSVEYLLLLAACFITAFLLIKGPVAVFTRDVLSGITGGLQNIVTNGEFTGDTFEFAKRGHPASPARLKPLHL